MKGVANALKTHIRRSDIIGRYGGEEFIALLPAIQLDAWQRVAEAIRHEVEIAMPAGVHVTISVGSAQVIIQTDPDAELYSWIAKADERLYSAKASGKNCVMYCA